MKLKFLGTGTSQGVPPIGCTHPVCLSEDPKDKRLRSSVIVTTDSSKKILIDCGPDFRQQMLTHNEQDVHSVLITHEHNDHVIGLDDLRPLIFKNGKQMPLYCQERVGEEIIKRFPYAFAEVWYPGAPTFNINTVNGSFMVEGIEVEPINVLHGKLPILGFKINNLAYITDASHIDSVEKSKLRDLDYLIINCLRREEKHRTHYILPEVLELVDELRPKMTYLTHISHHLGFHEELSNELPPHIQPAYDGLEIDF